MKKILALSALMGALASTSVMADDNPTATINVNGAISVKACTINASDVSKTITIPTYDAQDLVAAGQNWYDHSAETTVGFTNCPATVTSINIANITTNGTEIYDAYHYTPANGSATGISLVAGTRKGSLQANGSHIDQDSAFWALDSNGAVEIPIRIGVEANKAIDATAAEPTAGNYSSTFVYTFVYS